MRTSVKYCIFATKMRLQFCFKELGFFKLLIRFNLFSPKNSLGRSRMWSVLGFPPMDSILLLALLMVSLKYGTSLLERLGR